MQDWKRATLIGSKTFGKGSVQQIIPLESTQGDTQLRLTIAKYFLPSDRCIHEKGIETDIKIEPEETDEWTLARLEALSQKHVFEDYVREKWKTHHDLIRKLAIFDGKDHSQYPDFETFYASIKKEKISKDAVRGAIRKIARIIVQDEDKKEFACDVQNDRVLQRAIVAAFEKLNSSPEIYTWYKGLTKEFEEQPKPQTALEAALANEEAETAK